MKKLLALILTLMLAVTMFAACAKDEADKIAEQLKKAGAEVEIK